MMITIRPATQRGVANLGWLQSRHTFSFGQYRNPNEQGFSDLLVINDDRVAAQTGFGRHPHRDMEIFSYVLEGELEHKDSMGTGSVIRPGDVQLMSAGSGVLHSEFNPSTSNGVHFLQIWIVPNVLGAVPRYQQLHVEEAQKRGRLQLILAPQRPAVSQESISTSDTNSDTKSDVHSGNPGEAPSRVYLEDPSNEAEVLRIRQEARVYAGLFDRGEDATLPLPPNRYAYVHVAKGHVALNGIKMQAGDGARVRNESALHFAQGEGAEVIVFDLRPNEQPGE